MLSYSLRTVSRGAGRCWRLMSFPTGDPVLRTRTLRLSHVFGCSALVDHRCLRVACELDDDTHRVRTTIQQLDCFRRQPQRPWKSLQHAPLRWVRRDHLHGYRVYGRAGRYDNGRYSNGPLWVEHLADQLGLGPLAPNNGDQPLAMGTDFAYAGARSGTGGTDFIIPNLLTQIDCYLTVTGNTASPTALYTIWAGGNDVIDYIGDQMPNTPAAIEPFTDMMASNLSTAVTTLYNAGARKLLVANLPALGDKPDYVNTPNQAFANGMVTSFNPKLAQALANLRTQHSDLRVAGWDMYSDFNQVLNNPASFGFTNDTDAAFSSSGPYPGTVVANPNQHVFWDDTHPTAPGHQILGQFAYQALLQIPEPDSLVLLSMSIGIACGCGRIGRRCLHR